jgi:hypothetical protein
MEMTYRGAQKETKGRKEGVVYQISRSIYRRLAPLMAEDPADCTGSESRRRVLDACEETMLRMAEDRRYFAHPARSLFDEIRSCFSINDQVLVYMTVEKYVELADEYLARLPQDVTPFGEPRRCRATNRQGAACKREPLPGRDYCPSHKHLEEPVEWLPERAGYPAANPV